MKNAAGVDRREPTGGDGGKKKSKVRPTRREGRLGRWTRRIIARRSEAIDDESANHFVYTMAKSCSNL